MLLKNTETQYGAVTKTFHWTIAAIVICLLIVGLLMDGLPMGLMKLNVYNLHKSFGITVLFLMLCRIVWHIVSNRPHEVESLSPFVKFAASSMHYFLYVLLIAMPLTGWIFSSAAGRPVHVFGLPALPDLVGPDKETGHLFREFHTYIGYTIIACVTLHALAALKHHFIDKDTVLKRMLPAAVVFISLLASASPAVAEVRHWSLLHDKSSITFRPKQMGTEFKGTFGVFSGDIAFGADNLADSKAIIDIQIGTAHTGAPDRDENLKGKDWFDVAQFPDAKFETTSIKKADGDNYVAEGKLTIKNIALQVTLPFKLAIVDDGKGGKTATMDGSLLLDRSKFQIGTGQWVDTSIIANEVPVDIHVVAVSSQIGK